MSTDRREESEPRALRRVILVGRTGLDQSLRRDRTVELIRAADSMDAVGELSDPIDALSPTRDVVVVAPEAEPEGAERDAFLGALRSVSPDAAILLAGTGDAAQGYDGMIDPSSTGEDLARVLDAVFDERDRAGAEAPAADPEDTRAPERRSAPAAPDAPRPPIPAGSPADTAVIETALAGRDPVPEALRSIRARIGRDDISYEPAGAGARGEGPLVVPVHAGAVRLGDLVVNGATDDEAGNAGFRAALEAEAAWLGAWVRLFEQQRRLREAAFTDPLTGAWNRRYFDRYLRAAIDQVRGARLPMTVMVFDIDNFKAYNDKYGHTAGDEILIETVRLMNSVIRPSDRVCRIGGDEFAVVFYEPSGPRSAVSKPPDSVYTIARRFQKQICEHRFPKLGAEAQGTLTISGGLATYPWDGTEAESLLARADELAMRSKKQGKNALTLGPGAESACKIDP
ncbi:MAG: hypothetical protein DHS20C14_12620 [Phycisphaeraceae bacterium]|nr:MAG: hypothetical protein DHS20C14_12620 [Phycisphaeraceae bacterium]